MAKDNLKYEVLKNDFIEYDNVKLYRIRALRDIDGLLEEGELGGYIQSNENLDQNGDCWVGDNAIVYENARIRDNALVLDESIIGGLTTVKDSVLIEGCNIIKGNIEISGDIVISGNNQVCWNGIIKKQNTPNIYN